MTSAKEVAKALAEIANECCYRSDGYKEDIQNRIEQALDAYAAEKVQETRGMLEHSDELLRQAGERVGINFGCDTAEWMADEIIGLRAKLTRLERVVEAAKKFKEEWEVGDLETEIYPSASDLMKALSELDGEVK